MRTSRVTDQTTGHAGTIVLNSKKYGPLMPAFDTQEIGNALGWGLVDDTPNSFVGRSGTRRRSPPKSQFCLPGQTFCDSYNAPSWLGRRGCRSRALPAATARRRPSGQL